MSKAQILQTILSKNQGFITNREAVLAGVSSNNLLTFAKKEGLRKIDRGFYAKKEWPVDDYLVFQRRYPQFIYSYESALYLWGLTDQIVAQKIVTGPNGYHPYREKKKNIEGHFERNLTTYKMGVTTRKTIFGNEVFVYDQEKTICDLIRRRKEIDSEVFVKALYGFAHRKDRNLERLMTYARSLGIEEKVNEIMEIVINED
jgi:predicted transcriptional regulator of viral defense system